MGFVGVGRMGGAIAGRIVEAGWPTVVWARRPEVLDELVGGGARAAATPAELAVAVDLVGVCVWADEDVREVVAGERGLLEGCRPGTIVAVHSTIRPDTCRELAALAGARQAALLDAPVSGGPDVARAGSLAVAVGGEEAVLERCRPVLDAFASTIAHVGGVGAGQVAKLLNNALLAANLAVADDALTLGRCLDLDPAALTAFLREGSGRSFALDVALRCRTAPATREAARPALEKDVALLAAEAAAGDGLLDLAGEGVRRLREPPAGWADGGDPDDTTPEEGTAT